MPPLGVPSVTVAVPSCTVAVIVPAFAPAVPPMNPYLSLKSLAFAVTPPLVPVRELSSPVTGKPFPGGKIYIQFRSAKDIRNVEIALNNTTSSKVVATNLYPYNTRAPFSKSGPVRTTINIQPYLSSTRTRYG